MTPFLNFFEVRPGDFFIVPAGSVHAIGKDIMLAEIQQSSGITYRVWDWNRVDLNGDGRELHIAKAMDVLEFDAAKNTLNYFGYLRCIFSDLGVRSLTETKNFNVRFFSIGVNDTVEIFFSSRRYRSLICLEGTVSIQEYDALAHPFESLLISDSVNTISIDSSNEKASFLIVE